MNPLAPTADSANEADARVTALANGVRVRRLPAAATGQRRRSASSCAAAASTRARGAAASATVVEHMAFKGTRQRDCAAHQPRRRAPGRRGQRPHRQEPHRVPHARPGAGMPALSCGMLGDIVRESTFPEARARARAPGAAARVAARTRTTRCRPPSSCSTRPATASTRWPVR
ncbi:MAG: hypothetical protein MZW92_43135 [Comamonadaceae bacterium]|nr:hypothetical protein [Comamonadaceae bacterium]